LYVDPVGDDFAILLLCELDRAVAPGAPTGGCDPPQPASNAAAAPMKSAQRAKIFTFDASGS
jgi:hypothetical protein